jgi:hypothetical protein
LPASHGNHTAYDFAGSSGSVPRPAGVVADVVMLAFHQADTGTLAQMTLTGGATWQLLTSLSTGGLNLKVWWKVAGGSEPASYPVAQDSGSDGVVTIVYGVDVDTTATPIFSAPFGQTGSSGNLNTQGITPAGADDLEYRLYGGGGSGSHTWTIAASSPTFSQTPNIQSRDFSNHRVAYRPLTSSAATGVVAATSSPGQPNRQTVTVALKSLASGPPEVTGAVSLSAEGTMTTAGKLDVKGSVGLDADSFLTAAFLVPKVEGAASLSAEGILSIAAKANVKGSVAMSAQADLSVDGFVQAPPVIDPPLFPYTSVEIMFTDPTWTDVTPYFRGATVKRGSSNVDSPILRYEAGTANVRLDNRDRRFDPTNLSGPYVENFATDTGEQLFRSNKTFVFGHGVSVAVKSASGLNATIGNVTSKASGTTGSYTCDKPDGTVSGKLMVAIASCDAGSDTDLGITGGTSWGSPILSESSGESTLSTRVWTKIAGGSEPTEYTLTQNSFADGVCAIMYIDDADTSVIPEALWTDNPERLLITTPGVPLFGTNDLDLRWCAGNGYEDDGTDASWQSPTDNGFTEYADAQSLSFTSAVFAARSLTGYGGIGTETRVIPMLPLRIRSRWDFTPTTNLVKNPSFEEDVTFWEPISASTTAVARSDAFSYTGGQSLRLSRTTTAPSFFLYGVELDATGIEAGTAGGQTVTLSAYVYLPSASFAKVGLINFGLGGTPNAFVNMPPAADGWYRLQHTFLLSAAVSNVQIQFWTDDTHTDGQVVAYIDGVQLEVQDLATQYTDGSQPGCTWSGTAHESSSERPANVTFDVFNGFIDDWLIDWEGDYESEVNVPCTDGFALLADNDRTALGSEVGADELTGARVDRILDSVDWSVSARDIADGDTQVQGTTLSGDALTELFQVADTEIGEFYQNAAGTMVFRNRRALMNDTRSVEVQARFGDGGDVKGELPYHEVGIKYESTQLVNEVRIARVGGAQQTVEDAASKAKYRRTKVFERTDLLMTSDGEALAHASWILYIAKDAELRFDELTIEPQKDEERLFPQCLAREIGDRILVRRRPPGSHGEQIEREVFVRGVEHEIGQWRWTTKFTLQSASKVGNFLTLNHPELGRIGRNALVY